MLDIIGIKAKIHVSLVYIMFMGQHKKTKNTVASDSSKNEIMEGGIIAILVNFLVKIKKFTSFCPSMYETLVAMVHLISSNQNILGFPSFSRTFLLVNHYIMVSTVWEHFKIVPVSTVWEHFKIVPVSTVWEHFKIVPRARRI
jgi:hypothetical protein